MIPLGTKHLKTQPTLSLKYAYCCGPYDLFPGYKYHLASSVSHEHSIPIKTRITQARVNRR